MTTHAALRDRAGGWRLTDLAIEDQPDAGEVSLRMLYAPINPADLQSVRGEYAFPMAHGSVLGAEGVGEVVAVGLGVSGLRPGDQVLPLDRGNWCGQRMVRHDRLLLVPPGADPLRAAMMRINPATAYLLIAATQARPGDTIVQNAGRSSVAHWVRQIAFATGINVVSVVRGLPDDVGNIADGAGELPVAALDCVAGDATGRMADRVGEGGRVIVYGHLSGQPCTIPSTVMTGKGLTVAGFSLRPAEQRLSPEETARMWERAWSIGADVAPERRIGEVVGLSDLGHALAAAATLAGRRVMLDLTA